MDPLFPQNAVSSWQGIFIPFGRFVWLIRPHPNPLHTGYFAKGSLSRSEPTWLARTLQVAQGNQDTVFLEHLTSDRRNQRRGKCADRDAEASQQLLEHTQQQDFEQWRLDVFEAFFLVYALDALQIHLSTPESLLSIEACWRLFSEGFRGSCVNTFSVQYAVYHHYRSLGWAPKAGSKFGVDWVLYRPSRKHHHADYAVVVIPPECEHHPSMLDYPTLHRWTRVCTQIKKTLLLCYVTCPSPHCAVDLSPDALASYRLKEVIVQRWSAEKNRNLKEEKSS
ncbi:tRNA intron endonuclease [Syncephalastrum racemosum]|uniref:tRNA-splicing endonuclease subunit Sen2 n=1 Tax=Syncephalastrum racemosum TaxID=13706 RepID=A0A1X2HAQ9_SYNRA|nr:tRNA intron endonuclease [Syncephalastrum racemosum]